MNTLITAISPFVVNALAQILKKVPAFSSLTDGWHKTILRSVILVLSYVAAVGVAWLNDLPVDYTSMTMAVEAALTFLAAQGAFFLAKK